MTPQAPSTSARNFYRQHELEAGQIRILCLLKGAQPDTIRCNLQVVSLHDEAVYDALSYVGDTHLLNEPFT